MKQNDGNVTLTYRDAGVDIDRANALVGRFAAMANATKRSGVMDSIGGFGGLFSPRAAGFQDPILVSGTDGVGTKLKVAFMCGIHDTVGIDLVAMCVNDILTAGAEPLFFLDYFATGRLESEVAEAVIRGVAGGCERSGCALLGGETAEMPGMYPNGEYDLAGFAVGAVERDEIMSAERVRSGDKIIGIASDGVHSNGFSLVRKALFEVEGHTVHTELAELGRPLGQELLRPTRLYVRPVLAALAGRRDAIHGMAHITGGGLVENVPRALPEGFSAEIDFRAWPEPPVFDLVRRTGVPEDEMRRTFNLGIGFALVVDPDAVDEIVTVLGQAGEESFVIGQVDGP